MRLIIVFAVLVAVVIAGSAGIIMKMQGYALPEGASYYKGPPEMNRDLSSADNTLYLDLKDGRVVIQMRPDLAPMHVARIKQMVREGFYDGLTFHRVMDGFMAQTGDPKGDGTGGSLTLLKAEFSRVQFDRGIVGMARSKNVDSADSQFFIMLGEGRWLDGQYTVWGEVVEGMEFVDQIKKGDSANNGKVEGEPDKILKMTIASDAN